MHLETMQIIWAVWGVVVLAWLISVMYHSQITSKEEDQLFLSGNQEVQQHEQQEILDKVHHLTPIVRALGVIAGLYTVGIIGFYAYDAIKHLM